MKRTLAALLLGILTLANSSRAADASRSVVIISIDGCVPSLMQDEYAKNLKSLWQDGCYSWDAQTVNPSVTMVAHASMLTGVLPEKHGVKSNGYSADRDPMPVPTLLDLARKAGLQTAFIAAKHKMRHLEKTSAYGCVKHPRNEIEELGYDPRDPHPAQRPRYDVVRAVKECFGVVRPNVCFIHFSQPDLAGHTFGWGSSEYVYALRQVDVQIGELLAFWKRSAYLDQTLIIVTADHGGHEKTHGTHSPEDMTIPWIAWGERIRKNHELQTAVNVVDTAATAAYFLKLKVPKSWDGQVISEIFR